MILLNTAYFPPIGYVAAIANECRFNLGRTEVEPAVVYIEACEHYAKQSWRNRCRFYAADGAQTLNYPVCHEDFGKPISQVRIDWKTDWLTRHKRAIVSAYRTSPYFEYYQDELFAILDTRPELMLDFNTDILRFFLRKAGIPAELRFTKEWIATGSCAPANGSTVSANGAVESPKPLDTLANASEVTLQDGTTALDLREAIHPKRPDTILQDLGLARPYWQVFSPKHGFIPNLSIMDLLFNEGPDSISYLKKL